MPLQRIDHQQPERQQAFCDFVPRVFRRASFQRWLEWGQWADDYMAYAWVENDAVLANASVTRMQLCVAGERLRGWQLGAVGCIPEQRGRGLVRRCLDAALGACGDDPVLLFANPSVTALYPRFGFAAREEQVFQVEYTVLPAANRAPEIDLQSAAGRVLLTAASAHSTALTERFGAVDYARIVHWYAANRFARPLWQLAPDLLVMAGIEDEVLHIDDIVSPAVFDLRPLLPLLVDRPVRAIRFGFTPERWWPSATAVGVDADAHLFVRGFGRLPELPHKFPLLAQT